MADQLSSAQSLSTGELERLKEVAAAGRHGVLKRAAPRGGGYSRLVQARYVTVRPYGLEAYSYVITESWPTCTCRTSSRLK
jgi:hypothetical protein